MFFVIDVRNVSRYYSHMLIRDQAALQKHISKLRIHGEIDRDMAARLGIHVNTLTKLKHSTGMFELPSSLKALGLVAVFEVERKEAK